MHICKDGQEYVKGQGANAYNGLCHQKSPVQKDVRKFLLELKNGDQQERFLLHQNVMLKVVRHYSQGLDFSRGRKIKCCSCS